MRKAGSKRLWGGLSEEAAVVRQAGDAPPDVASEQAQLHETERLLPGCTHRATNAMVPCGCRPGQRDILLCAMGRSTRMEDRCRVSGRRGGVWA